MGEEKNQPFKPTSFVFAYSKTHYCHDVDMENMAVK